MHTVYSLTSSFSQLLEELGDQEVLEASAVCAEAEETLDRARLTVTIIACVGVVETNSSDSVGKAARLLKEKGVPEALRAKLRKVAKME